MSKLVRARPKAVEDLPEWAKCCDGHLSALLASGEMIIDLDRVTWLLPGYTCASCGRIRKAMKAVSVHGKNHFESLDLLDLDETGVPDGNYVEAVSR
jgi:hypothetical protein